VITTEVSRIDEVITFHVSPTLFRCESDIAVYSYGNFQPTFNFRLGLSWNIFSYPAHGDKTKLPYRRFFKVPHKFRINSVHLAPAPVTPLHPFVRVTIRP